MNNIIRKRLGGVTICGILCAIGCAAAAADFKPEITPLPSDPARYAPLRGYEPMPVPEDNPMTAEKAALGHQLFFDKRLSGDGTRSCYTCHLNDKGLADGRKVAIGAFDKTLTRNSPTLWNIGYHTEFYWDGRAKSLEAQAHAAWKGGNMGANPDEVVSNLNAIEGYRKQFNSVFGQDATPENVSQALACYMRTIISQNTPYDKWRAGDKKAMSESAVRGMNVFTRAKCDNCHVGLLMTSMQFYNVGVGMDADKPDIGRNKVTKLDKDIGAFKAPTLRDVSDSAPYFHDGSVATLEEAVRQMVDGGLPNKYLDTINLQKADLDETEFNDLIEFLKALDEPTTLKEPKLP
ncbi:MAG: cytochrome-c peroxidase [Planctomycetota bacterium]|jgi:cytochrome c peroxidase